MASEIVSEPAESSSRGKSKVGSTSRAAARLRFSAAAAGYVAVPFDSEKLPPTLVSDIRRFLRVANQVEAVSPRAAYLCRFHAFERAHDMDPNSNGRGVRQFKTSLLQRLEQDEQATILRRKEKNDARELESLYHKYKGYIRTYVRSSDSASRCTEQLMNSSEIASVLFDVLKTLTSGVGNEAIKDSEDIVRSSVPYNILPLGPGGEQHPIMQLPEVKAAAAAVRNIHGLPLQVIDQLSDASLDSFDWLQFCFGFQKGNVANQREHLIMLLANIHVRLIPKPKLISELDERAVDKLLKKLFRNYKNWCKFLGEKSNLCLPSMKQEVQQYKILYVGLYLLIWGEASNVRFMPECICYIFHHMACEMYGILSGALDPYTGKKVTPVYGGESESFLNHIITPLYKVIYKEAQKNRYGTADHSKWRNYDDLNEFFWSPDCFQLGWPMRLCHNFFYTNTQDEDEIVTNEGCDPKWLGKTNFVEIRSFWHIFRSFERMWIFFILALQVMIIMAWHDMGSLFQLFDAVIVEDITSIFVTSSILRLIQVSLDIAFMWKARHTMNFFQILRYFMKLITAATWTIILSVYYASSGGNSTCSIKTYWSGVGQLCISAYMFLVLMYLITNSIGIVLFLVPAVSIYIETSNGWIFSILSWWAQPRIYVGRGMQERLVPILKYTLFWTILLLSKFSFSYQFEIKPLVKPTKQIMRIGVSKYDWHELFPKVKHNAGAIVAVWAPIILVYFMDTQIWYAVFCTIFGGIQGVFHHLGEIRTMGMLRSRFDSLPAAFNVSLVPSASEECKTNASNFFQIFFCKVSKNRKNGSARFAQVWNHIIRSFRSEDLISNREMDLMIIPMSSELSSGFIRWPVFLLATKLSTAMNMAREFDGKEMHLYKKLRKDKYMYYAVKECYELLKSILDIIVLGDLEKRILSELICEVETSISQSTFLADFKLSELPILHKKCIQLVELLSENQHSHHEKVVKLLQDLFEIVTEDMMVNGSRILEFINDSQKFERNAVTSFGQHEPQLFSSITLPLPDSAALKEQIRRLLLLLTVKETAMDVPRNLEARRRISFFATSLFMDIPTAPKVQSMLSFSILTPYYMEEVTFSEDELHSWQDGASIFMYMQEIYPDEWKNFLERIKCEKSDGSSLDDKMEIRNWASFRGQTLSRTVRGMMYYRKALRLQAFLDMAEDEEILGGFTVDGVEHHGKSKQRSSAQLDALVDMKFTYTVSCQVYGAQKTSGDPRAQDILDLMIKYPTLRVAYIEEKEEINLNKPKKVYSSILIKAVNKLDQEIYRIKLPGPPLIGEGKPENQNHAIIFTRGDAVQAIDMNQDCYMEEALKMRNVLQEFVLPGDHPPTILGLREHIFTGSVSSLASFVSSQETSFVTIGQRLLANPLRVRFHYGHPDLFDRLFHITRGGISKASKTVNLSEDVYGGFNSTLRQGHVTYHEYMQVGKGRDVGLNQISKFEAKIANGNSEQTLSRDIYRLGHRFDFFRMLSCYFTTVGFYFNSLIAILGVYVFLYGQLYLILSGLDKALLVARTENIQSLETALASESFIQLGLLTGLPLVMEIGLEKGFRAALSDFFLMQLQLAAVFFTFSLGSKAHYYGRTLLHGGAKYRHTGRKFVVFHASFTENYRLYSRSHFVKGFELMLLLIVYDMFRQAYQNSMKYVLVTYSIWFMAGTWLFAPFLFNPSGFQWPKIVEDWKDWNRWITNLGGIGVHQEKSWESWWNDEQAHLKHSGWVTRSVEILLSLRFFIYQYGLVYHLDISQESKNFIVYVLSWFVIGSIFLLLKILSEGRRRLSVKLHLLFRIFKALLFLGILSFLVILFVICQLSNKDLFTCCLAFLPTGWGLLLIAQAVRPKIEHLEIWEYVQAFARAYDYGMGLLLFAPVAVLAWIPVISACQSRFLFNEAYNRHLKIQAILALAGKMKNQK